MVEHGPPAQGVILECWDLSPTSGSPQDASFSLFLCLCLFLYVSLMNKFLRRERERKPKQKRKTLKKNFTQFCKCNHLCRHIYQINFILFFKDFIYLFTRDTGGGGGGQRHRQREKRAPCRKPDTGLNPGSSGSRLGLKAALNC